MRHPDQAWVNPSPSGAPPQAAISLARAVRSAEAHRVSKEASWMFPNGELQGETNLRKEPPNATSGFEEILGRTGDATNGVV